MEATWSAEAMRHIDSSDELRIATRSADGSWSRAVPIWVVGVGGRVYVRTWHRRDHGWFGRAVTVRQARIEVPGLDAEVLIEDVGDADVDLRALIDDAYRAKYSRYGSANDRMITDTAAAATLQLIPATAGT